MHSFAFLTAIFGFQTIASAHMLLSYPPAFRYEGNPNVPSGSVDYSLTSPLKADGSDFPCKGYQSDLGSAAGASVATWSAGGTYNFTLGGSATHDGGSCQAALSYDKGKTFTVIHSYIGGCPTVTPAGGSFNFQVPSDAPAGAAMFAWTWFNEVGNREMYMDCASVTITGSSGKRAERVGKRAERVGKRAGTSFSSRPSLFVANLGNGCTTIESTDLAFPDPGPDVTDVTKAPGGVTGTCKQVAGIGDFASGSANAATVPAGSSVMASSVAPAGTSVVASSAPSAAPAASTSSANAGAGTIVTAASSYAAGSYAAQTSSGSQTATMSSAASTASSAGTSTSGLSLSSDGSCGGTFGCQGSIHGNCCSEWGWCGSTSAYCGTGCQSAFGSCGTSNSSSSGSAALQVSTDKTCGPTTSNTCQGSTYGNCCSQYGYCGSTSDYCDTGCQAGFGSCGQASSGSSSSSPSSAASSSSLEMSSSSAIVASSSPSALPSSRATSQTTGGAYTAASSSSANSPGFVGVTQPTSRGSTFITMVKPTTTTTTTSMSSTYTPDLITIIPTHLRRQSGKTISPNGLCGSSTGYTCMGSNFGECCSQYGYCGSSDAYCGTGCQNPFGSCEVEIIPLTGSA